MVAPAAKVHLCNTGAVALSELSSMGAIVNCSFDANSAPWAAGSAASIISNNLFTVFGTNFTSNAASLSQGHPGGALFHSSQDSGALTLLISRSSFVGNSGGAVSAVGSYIVVNATSFKDNIGGTQAGAITCESCVRLLLQACEVEGSVSDSPGGAIQTTGQSASGVLLDQVTASNNRWVAFLMLFTCIASGPPLMPLLSGCCAPREQGFSNQQQGHVECRCACTHVLYSFVCHFKRAPADLRELFFAGELSY